MGGLTLRLHSPGRRKARPQTACCWFCTQPKEKLIPFYSDLTSDPTAGPKYVYINNSQKGNLQSNNNYWAAAEPLKWGTRAFINYKQIRRDRGQGKLLKVKTRSVTQDILKS